MQLTIILTLKDRSDFTLRWMRYMNDMKCSYHILIADGGKDAHIEQHLLDKQNYPFLQYEYIRYPYDATIDDFYRKFEDVISRVRTEYMLLADNDDFFLLNTIPALLEFLDNNPAYVGARGRLGNFSVFGNNTEDANLVSGGKYQAVLKEAISIESDDKIDRVEFLCANMSRYDYYINWYCIFCTKHFSEVYRNLNQLPIKEVLVHEMLINVLIALKGKIYVSPELFILRQVNTSMLGDALISGNSFLERCIITNAFSEFGIAIDRFSAIEDQNDRNRVLRAIAGWLGTTISNIYLHNRKTGGFKSRLRLQIRKIPLLGNISESVYLRLIHLLFPVARQKKIQTPVIEPYIINKNWGK